MYIDIEGIWLVIRALAVIAAGGTIFSVVVTWIWAKIEGEEWKFDAGEHVSLGFFTFPIWAGLVYLVTEYVL